MSNLSPDYKNFKDLVVEAPNADAIKAKAKANQDALAHAKTASEAIQAIRDHFALSDAIYSDYDVAYIRHSIDTNDAFYQKLTDIYNDLLPELNGYDTDFGNAVLASPFKPEIEKAFGSLWLQMLSQAKKTFSPAIVPLLQKENALSTEYGNLTGKGTLTFEGKTYSLEGLGKFRESLNREERKAADDLYWAWFRQHDEQIGALYGEMIHTRNAIAKALGYDNFVGLAYDRMGRLDWDVNDIHAYRKQVKEDVVPLCRGIWEDQRHRLGYSESDILPSDYNIFFKEGNPAPKGTPDALMDKAQAMYDDMDPNIAGPFFRLMRQKGMFDLLAKKGKQGGGYESYVPALKMPFIFSNFNGTYGDVDVLTHEFGHALQAYLGRDIEVPAYRSPTAESCEMHSMSMEFLAHPYMESFFGSDADRYRYLHVAHALTFIPYGTIVDAFQEHAYSHEEETHAQRKAYWRQLEKDYLPYTSCYDKNAFLASGGKWERQHHIFEIPFYYVDYTISQVVSLEFFAWSLKDPKAAYEKYIAFSRLGGTLSYKSLMAKAGIPNPMVPPTLKDTANAMADWLSAHAIR